MENKIMSFTEIKKYPLFYLSEMIQNPSDSFLLYQYGPYMLMHIDSSKILNYTERIKLYYKNPVLSFMIDISDIIKTIQSDETIGHIKETILGILTRSQDILLHNNINDQSVNIFLQRKKEIVFDIIGKIQDYQYENKSLESAILNYAPIVPYTGSLIKPGMETPTLTKIEYNSLDKMIKEYLKDNIIEIMLHNEEFISVDNYDSEYILRENELSTNGLSYDIIKLYNLQENNIPSVKTYFTLVYLRYAAPEKNFYETINEIIKLNTTYNKIIKGEIVDMKEAVETFSKLSLPPNSSLIQ